MKDENLGHWTDVPENEAGEDPPDSAPTMFNDDDRDDLLGALRQFCLQLDFRLETFTDRDPSMYKIFESDVNLRGDLIGQKSHEFIGRWLVEPIFSAANYNYISEPRRSQVELERGRAQIYPDFRLISPDSSISQNKDIIGEIKNPGSIGPALYQLKNEYLTELSPPAFGIATDGVVLKLRVRDEEGISRPSGISQVQLRSLLHKIRRGIVHDRASYQISQFRDSDELNRLILLLEQLHGPPSGLSN